MKLKLNLDDLADDFFENSHMLGLVAPVKDYQFCWHLNQLLRFDFRINNDIEIQLLKKQRHYYFAIFEYREPNSFLTHYLYNNQFDGEYLLPEFKHLDFLWLLKGDSIADDYLNKLQATLKGINGVQLVTELNYDKIRNRGHLIF